jgi:hypothetical protein
MSAGGSHWQVGDSEVWTSGMQTLLTFLYELLTIFSGSDVKRDVRQHDFLFCFHGSDPPMLLLGLTICIPGSPCPMKQGEGGIAEDVCYLWLLG